MADNRAKLDRLLELYLSGEFGKDMLLERKQRLEHTIASLEEEHKRLAVQLSGVTLTEEQIAKVKRFAAELREGLKEATEKPTYKRQLLGAVEFKGTLTVENGKRVAYLQCALDEKRVSQSRPAQVLLLCNS